jgi:hypothetical protein
MELRNTEQGRAENPMAQPQRSGADDLERQVITNIADFDSPPGGFGERLRLRCRRDAAQSCFACGPARTPVRAFASVSLTPVDGDLKPRDSGETRGLFAEAFTVD